MCQPERVYTILLMVKSALSATGTISLGGGTLKLHATVASLSFPEEPIVTVVPATPYT